MKEIGTQRAIGMSMESLYRTFLWEGAYYGMIATVTGSIGGYLCSILTETAAAGELMFAPIPAVPILEAAAACVAACLLATAAPLKRIAKMGIVEAIGAVE